MYYQNCGDDFECEDLTLQVQYIGYYDDELEAAKAYDRAILKFRGPGHQVNFPEADYTPEEIASAPKVEPQVRGSRSGSNIL